MLRIRFLRTGKVGQPSFRIVVAEHSWPVKGKHLEVLGHYLLAQNPKVFSFDKDRILHWISKGAVPTGSVASLLKKEGMLDMEKYIIERKRQRKHKGEEEKEAAAVIQKAQSPEAPTANEAKAAA